MDESCSVVNNYILDEKQTYSGGVIGYCYSYVGKCIIENNVNMASILFNGSTNGTFIGGIAGALTLRNYQGHFKNCANYGTVSSTGTSSSGTYIGGVVGSLQGTASYNVLVHNCANYGAVDFIGSSNDTNIGGVAGYSEYTEIDNCLSSGVILRSSYSFIGIIVGYGTSSSVSNCMWTKDVGQHKVIGVNVKNSHLVEQLNETTRDELNTNLKQGDGLSKWVVLYLNGGKINNLDQDILVVIQKSFPDPVKDGNSFLFWCKDLDCEGGEYNRSTSNVTDLYAVWEMVGVAFDYGDGTATKKILSYGENYSLPDEPEKEGHTFSGWFIGNGEEGKEITNETKLTISRDHTLYPHWTINNYTVTFDYGNGTTTAKTLKYNEEIRYPENLTREGCSFTGWDRSPSTVTARNTTTTAQWDCTQPSSTSSKSSGNTGAIVGGVVGAVALLAIVAFVIFFVLFSKRKRGDGYDDEDDGVSMAKKNPRIVEKAFDASGDSENEGNKASEAALQAVGGVLAERYLDDYRIPSIAEALQEAGLSGEGVEFIVNACALVWNRVMRRKGVKEGIPKEDVEAVALYTFDFGSENYESNPYRIINKALVTGNIEDLLRASGMLYLVVSALRRLPRRKGVTLYRGIREGVNMNLYREGSHVVWRGLSSTSPDMGATKAFLANSPSAEQMKGTLFVIENGWGYDLQPYSMFPDEEEILLEPLRCFRVQSVINSVPIVIKLEMLDTPLLLPQVLGEETE